MRGRTSRSASGTVVPLARSSKPSTHRDRERMATRARILKAAREIFFRDGFADTNLDEVAARAEVGKGTP